MGIRKILTATAAVTDIVTPLLRELLSLSLPVSLRLLSKIQAHNSTNSPPASHLTLMSEHNGGWNWTTFQGPGNATEGHPLSTITSLQEVAPALKVLKGRLWDYEIFFFMTKNK